MQEDLRSGRLNQLGGMFVNGKPLPNSVRQRIIEMAELGIRPCDISRQLRISHGCISKLLSKYNETGSFEPGRAKRKTSRDVSTEVKNKIEEYRRETPAIFSWEVRDRLVTDGLCNKESLPPLTVISRLLRRARSESDVPSESARQNENKPKGFTAFSIDNILRKEEQMETSTSPTETESDSSSCTGSTLTSSPVLSDLPTRTNSSNVHLRMYQRRNRTKFTAEQIEELDKAFEKTQYPDALTREELAERLDISESKIQIWFSNQRSKEKRMQRTERTNEPSPGPIRTRIFYPTYPVVPVIRYAPYHPMAPCPYMLYNSNPKVTY